jgi:hypothetical protein
MPSTGAGWAGRALGVVSARIPRGSDASSPWGRGHSHGACVGGGGSGWPIGVGERGAAAPGAWSVGDPAYGAFGVRAGGRGGGWRLWLFPGRRVNGRWWCPVREAGCLRCLPFASGSLPGSGAPAPVGWWVCSCGECRPGKVGTVGGVPNAADFESLPYALRKSCCAWVRCGSSFVAAGRTTS